MNLADELMRGPKIGVTGNQMSHSERAEQRANKVVQLFDAGKTRRQIADETGFSYAAVAKCLSRRGRGR